MQGSIVGPFIWNLVMDELLCDDTDDRLIPIERNSWQLKHWRTAWSLSRWWGLNGKNHRDVAERKLTSSATCQNLKYEKRVTYLGDTKAERMHLGFYLIQFRTRLTELVHMLRHVIRCEWGLSRRAVGSIYIGPLSCMFYVQIPYTVWFYTDNAGHETALH